MLEEPNLARLGGLGSFLWCERLRLRRELKDHDQWASTRLFSMQLGAFDQREIADVAGGFERERQRIVERIDEIDRQLHG